MEVSPIEHTSGKRRGFLRRCLAAVALVAIATPALAGELLIGAAVSLREPVRAIVREYAELHPETLAPRTSFGASSVLSAQIEAGAPIDVFLSADDALVERLVRAGRVAPHDHFELARNALVVVAARGSALAAHPPTDAAGIAGDEVLRFAIPGPAVPLGRYARTWLASQGLLAALEGRLIVTEHARATLSAVETGAADAAVLYRTDARTGRGIEIVFEIPPAAQPRIRYAAARVTGGNDADAFLAFLRSAPARALLQEAGFIAPPS